MPWTYPQIKAAINALPAGSPSDLVGIATMLNSQTQTLAQPAAPVSVAAVHGILMLAPTADWLRIEARAALPFSAGFPASPVESDAAIAAAKLAITLTSSKVEVIDPAAWAGFEAQIGVLVASGDISAASQSAIAALAPLVVPAWQPALHAGDIQIAEAV